MSEPKFTPGPWLLIDDNPPAIETGELMESDRKYIVPVIRGRNTQERDANARLMASAPDLYRVALIDEAMQTIGYTEAACRWLRERGVEPPPRERLGQWQKEMRRAALAKAGAADGGEG